MAGDLGLAPASYDWSGGYVGVNAGAALNSSEFSSRYAYTGQSDPGQDTLDLIDDLGFSSSPGDAWFTAGMLAGYNWQMGGLVSGIEVDIGPGNVGGSYTNLGSLVQPDLNAIGSLRGRLGILATPQALLYATGGLAWANYDFKATAGNTVSDTLVGYQIGAGLEYMIAPQWTMRIEYNFTDFGSARIDQGGVINSYDPDLHTVRAGIAYKF